ncbi:MAG: Fe-S protein assembly co-chaperone HscB [Candidatus Rokuibacteriota bacterium]|nr:MAG: Fe-S protein assembly co-chaperone HscB [Candidatus Rokubacteria bacterium]
MELWLWNLVFGIGPGPWRNRGSRTERTETRTGPDGPVRILGRGCNVTDYFEVFGLPRKLSLDLQELQRRFYDLSRRHHPDFHQTADAEAQTAALEASALVNRAYRTLRDPLARVEYVIALEEGREVREETSAKPKPPVDLLEEMLEVQEALQEAKSAGLTAETAERLRGERDRLEARRRAEETAVIEGAAEWDSAVDGGADRRPLVDRFKQRLAARAYLRTVIEDLGQALGEDAETHVAHRRH